MEQAELSQLSGVIRSAMGESAGRFREAAESGNANLSKIMGTVAAAIKAQRQDIAELGNIISENESISERNSSTLQAIQSELQDINSGIHDIAIGMKNMARGISNVDNSIFRLNQDLQSSIGQSLLPGLLTGLSGTASSIVKGITALAVGGLAIGGAKTAMEYMTGGGGAGGGLGGGTAKIESNEFYKAIIDAEGTAKHGNPYDTSLGYMKSPKPLTQMTMDESLAWGEQVKAAQGMNSSAKGAFQIVNTTQRKAMAALGMKGSDLFNEENQKKMASWIAHKQGLGAWEGLKIHPQQMQIARQAMQAGVDKQFTSQQSNETTSANPVAQSSATPQSSPMQSQYEQPPVSSDTAPRVERIGGEHGHGPISGAAQHGGSGHGEQGKLAGVQPGILQKFHQIESQAGTQLNVTSGFRDPAHNAAVGGAKNSAHTRGNAVDVTFNGGVEQTNKLIETASNAGIGGIGVYRPGVLHFDTEAKRAWGPDYHLGSVPDWAKGAINKHLGGSTGSSAGGGEASSQSTPGSLSAMTPVTPAVSAGTPAGTPAVSAGITPDQMAMITGGMNPMAMAATTAMLSQLQSAQQEASAIAPQQQQPEYQTQQLDQAQILSQLSKSSENTQIVQQAAVAKQAQQEISQQEPITDLLNSIFGQLSSSSSTVVNNNSNIGAGGYNGQYDIGWPDWAEMIGGNHWKEMKNYKKNMWG